MSAQVRHELLVAAVGAAVGMPAQRWGAAGKNRAQGFPMVRRQMAVGRAPRRVAGAHVRNCGLGNRARTKRVGHNRRYQSAV